MMRRIETQILKKVEEIITHLGSFLNFNRIYAPNEFVSLAFAVNFLPLLSLVK